MKDASKLKVYLSSLAFSFLVVLAIGTSIWFCNRIDDSQFVTAKTIACN